MVSIEFTVHTLRDLQRLDPSISKPVIEKIYWLQQNFDVLLPAHLHRDRREQYKLRIGNYRVVYSINGNTITIETVDHRRDVYK